MTLVAGALAVSLSCDAPLTSLQPIFINGRAVYPDGDSLFAVTTPEAGVLFLDRRGRPRDSLGGDVLAHPGRVQILGDSVYVSDTDEGQPRIALFTRDGRLVRRVAIDTITREPHQFAALPDGRIVLEAPDRRLVSLYGDSLVTFAVVDRGTRPSLLTAVGGGVLHAVPDQSITLYNGFGNIRWRIAWPWVTSAYVSDLAVDSRGRVHLIVGAANEDTFTVQTLAQETGEVVRWSEPTRESTFVVDRVGEVRPAPDRSVRR